MNGVWPEVKLGEVLRQVERREAVDPEREYRFLGAKWYALGLYVKEALPASAIAASYVYRVEPGDFVYNRLFAWKGSFAVATDAHAACFVSNEFPCFRADETRLDAAFLWWYFKQEQTWTRALGLSVGATPTSRNRLKEGAFLSLTIPLPPLAEQRRIVARLDALAAKIEEAMSLRTTSDRALVAIRRSALDRLMPLSEPLGTLADVLDEPPRNGWSARCDGSADGTAVLSLSAVTGFAYDPTAFKRTSEPTVPNAHYWLQPGDLLITRSNTPELVGHAAIYSGVPFPCIYSDLMMRLRLNRTLATAEFVHLWLQTTLVRDYIKANATGTSPTMKKIAQGTVQAIPYPRSLPLERQRAIAERVAVGNRLVRDLTAVADTQMSELAALLPSVLDRAFAGAL